MNRDPGIREGFKDSSSLQTYTPPYYQRSGVAAGVYVMPVGVGSFLVSGQAVALKAGRRLSLGAGTFSLVGKDITLRKSYPLAIGVGTFTLSGKDVTLRKTEKLDLGVGVFSLLGKDVALKSERRLSLGTGTFSLTGQDVDLVYTPLATRYTLDIGAGTFSLVGKDILLTHGGEAWIEQASSIGIPARKVKPVDIKFKGRAKRKGLRLVMHLSPASAELVGHEATLFHGPSVVMVTEAMASVRERVRIRRRKELLDLLKQVNSLREKLGMKPRKLEEKQVVFPSGLRYYYMSKSQMRNRMIRDSLEEELDQLRYMRRRSA